MNTGFKPALILETRAKGKLLLSGEYFVMDGATALAIPTTFGQSLHIESWKENNRLSWTSKNELDKAWFLAEFELPELEILNATDRKIADTLVAILQSCQRQNPGFLDGSKGYKALTKNDFPRTWGLGTSSTLIAAIALWAQTDPYRILADTLGGSGYDLACAYARGPVLYQLVHGQPVVKEVNFAPNFTEQLLFVYLDKKQDSRAGIKWYREKTAGRQELVETASYLTNAMAAAADLSTFMEVMDAHESFVSQVLELPRVQAQLFPDFPGQVKSLGAWGGDFVLAASAQAVADMKKYFQGKGFNTLLEWREMVY